MNQRRLLPAIVGTWLLLLALVSCQRSQSGDANVAIGAILPLSGENASFGTTARSAYEIAEEDAKQEGRKTFRLIYGDSRLEKEPALKEYRRMVDEDHVVGFVEVTGSGLALALTQLAARDQVPILSAVDTSPELTAKGGPFFFRIVPSDAYSSKVLSEWAIEKEMKSAVLIYNQQNDWAVGFKNASLSAFRQAGGQLPDNGILAVTNDTVDFSSAIERLNRNAPRAWFVGLMGRQAGLFVKQAVGRGIKGPFLGVDNFAQQEFLDAAGPAATHAWFVLPTEIRSDAAGRFSAEYQQRYNRVPDSLAFKAYDAYFVVLHAVDELRHSGQPVNGLTLQRALKSTDIQGITGPIQFDEHDDLLRADYQRLIYDANGRKTPAQ